MRVFTSVNLAYLDRAMVLQETVRLHNPDWIFTLILVDEIPIAGNYSTLLTAFDQVVLAKDLGIPNFDSWIRKFTVVEACTAVKGFALEFLLNYDQGVTYLDPDIAVFHDLGVIEDLLLKNDIVLTPHLLEPEKDFRAISDNEVGLLKHGSFNLGFIAVGCTDEGKKFASWWAWRLYDYCFEDFENGLFVDQKWIDLVPAFFENVLVWRHRGANLASWNINQRELKSSKDEFFVDGEPLLFLHFTKARTVGPAMTMRYGYNNIPLIHLWRWYIDKLNQYTSKVVLRDQKWAYAK